ncbi:hypothetical protein AVEN_55400-1 [Araneus ventricosus]|uniref:Uncharacterized protein n=1 Tax=Araneus ventricosus TaxID=182803 RepID=A0A4Y2CJY4_ARAVE|nr:hypothetical protein AVEN_55400-1 [Araneus ventricosus]
MTCRLGSISDPNQHGVYSGALGWVGFRKLTTEPHPTGGTRIDPNIIPVSVDRNADQLEPTRFENYSLTDAADKKRRDLIYSQQNFPRNFRNKVRRL